VPYVIGLTGNIGCGKSTIGGLLQELGAEYIDADAVVHELYRPDTEEYHRIVERFGREVVDPSGSVDRRKLAQIVFADAAALEDLEAILHPAVRARIRARISASAAPVVVVDAIKLLESPLLNDVQTVWVVTCTSEQQVARLLSTRGYSEQEARTRINAQPSQEDKVRRADVVIDNSGSLAATRAQVEAAWQQFMKGLAVDH
jgi:dephospho-CoA kinase